MKRLAFLTLALLAIVGRASAQNAIACSNITAQSGQQVDLPIQMTNDAAISIVGISFTLTLPEGVTFKEKTNGKPTYALVDSRLDSGDFTVTTQMYSDGSLGVRIVSLGSTAAELQGTEGTFMTFTLDISESLEADDYYITLTENKLSVRNSDNSVTSIVVGDSTSKLTISDSAPTGYVLDENSSEEIVAGTYPQVILKRTFVAGWNTVCLPFDIDEVEAFFGTGAKAYDFAGVEDGELSFVAVDELTASLPYVVYVPTAITEDIELANVVIDDESTEADVVSFKKKYYFRGTYAPIAPGEWEKKSNTDDIYGVTSDGRIRKAGTEAYIKGFRAYFDLPAGAAVKAFWFDGDATGIKDLKDSNDIIYNVAGLRLNKIQKGINIINGKKTLK